MNVQFAEDSEHLARGILDKPLHEHDQPLWAQPPGVAHESHVHLVHHRRDHRAACATVRDLQDQRQTQLGVAAMTSLVRTNPGLPPELISALSRFAHALILGYSIVSPSFTARSSRSYARRAAFCGAAGENVDHQGGIHEAHLGERPAIVELFAGLSSPNRACLSAHPALHLSVAQSQDQTSVARFEGITLLLTQIVRITFRYSPSELTLPTRHESPQCDATGGSPTITPPKNPRRGPSYLRGSHPAATKRLERGSILAREPVAELPKAEAIQTPEHHVRIVSESVEVSPTRKNAVQVLDQVNTVSAVVLDSS